MYRHESQALARPSQYRAFIALLGGAIVAIGSGCIPAEEGLATDAATTAAGAAISQFLGFISDFARQLLAAYFF